MSKIPPRKITLCAFFLALSLLLPYIVHVSGLSGGGSILLPMHIPVLLAGFAVGPLYGGLLGIVAPAISMLFIGMPTAERLPFMMLELFCYGLVAGLLYRKAGLRKRRFGAIVVLVLAMISGRLIYALSLVVAAYVLNLDGVSMWWVVTALTKGALGIGIQLVLVPTAVYALERSNLIND